MASCAGQRDAAEPDAGLRLAVVAAAAAATDTSLQLLLLVLANISIRVLGAFPGWVYGYRG